MPIQGAINHESVTVGASAVGITTGGDGVEGHAAFMTVEDAQVSFTVDGTAPTASTGHLADPGDSIVLTDRGEVMQFRAIRTGGVSGTLKVTLGTQYTP